ncbi:MAG: tail fiber protein [Burkholderiaceae bacterium]|jgi:microcystin-dependent protein|nr:tail fiber protein [Burkholderiaceae bacterium]
MAVPFLGEIRIASFGFAPKNWALCNGQLLPINQNQALFSLLGTNYGGNGTTTFGLPDLRGRMPLSFSSSYGIGQQGGSESHTIKLQELPQHTHMVTASANTGNRSSPSDNLPAASHGAYAPGPDTALAPASVTSVGSTQPHYNMPPYLTLSFIIAIGGIFPSPD